MHHLGTNATFYALIEQILVAVHVYKVDKIHFIGVSLSEPHINGITVHKIIIIMVCICMVQLSHFVYVRILI